MANLTGGTSAPVIRMNAAARALGAPKVVGQKPQRPTPSRMPGRNAPALPRAQGITQHQAAPQRPAGQHQAAREAAAHRPPAPKAPSAKAGLDPMQEYKTGKYANPAEIQKIATRMTQNEDKAQLAPYKQQGREIGSAESSALGRNTALAAAAQPNLQAIQSEGEASAKTGENNAAEAAVAAAKSIESTGQSAATANGGYTAPQVASALGQAGAQAGALGGAASQYQSAMGAAGTGFMTAMRAAAADRASEGATRLQQGYGAAQTKNTQEEDKTLSRLVPGQEKRALELPEEQVKDNVALRDVGAKEGSVAVAARKNVVAEKGNAEKNRTTREDAAEKNRVTAQGNADKNQTQIAEKKDWTSIAVAEKNNKAKTEAAALKAGGHSTAEETKLTDQLTAAYGAVKELAPGKWSKSQIEQALLAGKIGKTPTPKVTSQPLIQAAYELYMHHEINNVTRAQLNTLGFPSYIKPSEVVGLS